MTDPRNKQEADDDLDRALALTFPASDPIAVTPPDVEDAGELQPPPRPADQRERSDSTRRRFTPKSE